MAVPAARYLLPVIQELVQPLDATEFVSEHFLDQELYTIYLRNKPALPPYFWDGERFIDWVKLNVPWVLTRVREARPVELWLDN